jgi:hypothetical protein
MTKLSKKTTTSLECSSLPMRPHLAGKSESILFAGRIYRSALAGDRCDDARKGVIETSEAGSGRKTLGLDPKGSSRGTASSAWSVTPIARHAKGRFRDVENFAFTAARTDGAKQGVEGPIGAVLGTRGAMECTKNDTTKDSESGPRTGMSAARIAPATVHGRGRRHHRQTGIN